ncbi:MAG: FapA family protein [Candidatus Carbobacillus sp.]|nr:FapA family protein [Candidatus Carbobacillus sp.]
MAMEERHIKKIRWDIKPEKIVATLSEANDDGLKTMDETSEHVWTPGGWTLERLIQYLQKHGVRHGYNYTSMNEFLKGQVGPYVLAQATPSHHGEDARVEWMVEIEDRDLRTDVDEEDAIDYRALKMRPSVPAHTALGRIIPPKAGKPGEDVFGRPLLPKPGRELDIVSGEGVSVDASEGVIYSTRAGYLNVKQKKRRVYVQVSPVHTHRGNVSLATGNIELHGSLVIQGDVEEGMRVWASEDVRIEGSVHSAQVIAGEALVVTGPVFRSAVISGTKDLSPLGIRALNDLKHALIRLLRLLEQVRMNPTVSKRLEDPRYFESIIRKLAENQDNLLKNALKTLRPFWDNLIRNNEEGKEDKKKWLMLWRLFIGSSFSQTQPPMLLDFTEAVRMVVDVSERFPDGLVDKSSIMLRYGQNAHIFALGDVHIGEGVYLSEIQTFGHLKVRGFVRGGTIVAENGAQIEEAGSEAGVETVIKVGREARVYFTRVFPEVTVMIGDQTYRFTEARQNVRLLLHDHHIKMDVV